MLDWNMPVSALQVIVPPVAGAVVSLISVLSAYLIGRGAERRKQRDLIYEANHKAMNDLLSGVNILTSTLNRHIASREYASDETFDKMWEILTGASWVPGRRDGRIKDGVLQPTDEGLVIDVWLRTKIHSAFHRFQNRDLDDEYEDQELQAEISQLYTLILKWSIRDKPSSWFVDDIKDYGMRMFLPLYYRRQSDLVPMNLPPAAQEFLRQGMEAHSD